MNKHWDKSPDNKTYTLTQLDELKYDLTNLIVEMGCKFDEIEKIKCGLTVGHKWLLHKFDDRIWPGADPPGAYTYRCERCGEIIILRADKKEIWEVFINAR